VEPPHLDGRLNRWIEGVLAHHPPPAVAGRRLKIKYITQVKTRPPGFVLSCSRRNPCRNPMSAIWSMGLRESFDMPGVPIRIAPARFGEPVCRPVEETQLSRDPAFAARHAPLTAPSRLMQHCPFSVGKRCVLESSRASTTGFAAGKGLHARRSRPSFLPSSSAWASGSVFRPSAPIRTWPAWSPGPPTSGARWSGFVEKSVAGSVHSAEMAFVDGDIATGSISGSGLNAPGIGAVAFKGKGGSASGTPDEDRVVRSAKKGRIVKVAPVAPPKAFNAGSVLRAQQFAVAPDLRRRPEDGLRRPDIKGKEIEIATAFYVRRERVDPGVPAAIADLVTNDKGDVLATAYAPAEPDYAKASPFESLLREEPVQRPLHPAGGARRP
jgi:hypothetical protein